MSISSFQKSRTFQRIVLHFVISVRMFSLRFGWESLRIDCVSIGKLLGWNISSFLSQKYRENSEIVTLNWIGIPKYSSCQLRPISIKFIDWFYELANWVIKFMERIKKTPQFNKMNNWRDFSTIHIHFDLKSLIINFLHFPIFSLQVSKKHHEFNSW
jgi:hypothetical protein